MSKTMCIVGEVAHSFVDLLGELDGSSFTMSRGVKLLDEFVAADSGNG